MKYLPSFDLIRRSVEISSVRGELRVSVSYDDFIKILRMMISGIEVNEEWYLNEHQDIAQAAREGSIHSAKQHFTDDGYFEGRRPFPMPVDEQWYLEQYPTWPRACAMAASSWRSSTSTRTAIARAGYLMLSRCLR